MIAKRVIERRVQPAGRVVYDRNSPGHDTHCRLLNANIIRTAISLLLATSVSSLIPSWADSPPEPTSTDNVVISAMQKELDRSFSKLKNAGTAPLYFIGYRIVEDETVSVTGDMGALQSRSEGLGTRQLNVELRVGSPACDNTHKIRGDRAEPDQGLEYRAAPLPVENDEASIRNVIWLKTDGAFKQAQKQYAKVQAARDVKLDQEDASDDFSLTQATKFSGPPQSIKVDRDLRERQMRTVSAVFRNYPLLRKASVTYGARLRKKYVVNSEGSCVTENYQTYNLSMHAETIADDGMDLWLDKEWYEHDESKLPNEKQMLDEAEQMAKQVMSLRTAPVAEPYVGPAILRNRAAAVFIHEVLGHRVEGHRQKDEEDGRTFTGKVGTEILPNFISVVDDPTRTTFGPDALNGHYAVDDEGVPAQKVSIVNHGVLRSYLMARSPISGFKSSNGHGRADIGKEPVARQANLITEADAHDTVSFEELRKRLIEEIKKQKKPYGLVFDDLEGGSTMTGGDQAQSLTLYPLLVTRVYADGRPDELIRGVDVVGTPLTALESVLAAGNDPKVFNGECGAESGWIPVSAVSPSLLVEMIEVQRVTRTNEKPPLLPDPSADSRLGSR